MNGITTRFLAGALAVGVLLMMLASGCSGRVSPAEETPSVQSEEPAVLSAVVAAMDKTGIQVVPDEGSPELASSDRFAVPLANLEGSLPNLGDRVEVRHNGDILEAYPASFGQVFSVRVTEPINQSMGDVSSWEWHSACLHMFQGEEVFPNWELVTGREALEAYVNNRKLRYETSSLAVPAWNGLTEDFRSNGFAGLFSAYDSEWFAGHDLLLVMLQEPSCSIWHEVVALTQDHAVIDRLAPACQDEAMAWWLFLVEMPKGALDEAALRSFGVQTNTVSVSEVPLYEPHPQALMADGQVYYNTYIRTSPLNEHCCVFLVMSSCHSDELPNHNQQGNFGTGYRYQFIDQGLGQLQVQLEDGHCYLFATEEVRRQMTELQYEGSEPER